MINLLLAILLGIATPTGTTGNSTTNNSTTCNPDCTEEDHTCDDQNDDGPGGETGQVPPKK